MFLYNGAEVYDGREIERGSDVYISMGEDFKNPDANAKRKKFCDVIAINVLKTQKIRRNYQKLPTFLYV